MINYTIIIPHFNSPQLLKRCLASVPDNEETQVIVVDDNSDPQVVDFNDFPGRERKNTQIIFNKNRHGAGHARNLALPHSKGKWLIFADADDFFLPNAWKIFDSYLNSDADIIYFNYTSVDGNTLQANNRQQIYGKYFEAYYTNPTDFNRDHLRYRHDIPWGKMIRKSLIDTCGITFGETKYCNDTLFSTRSALVAQKVIIEQRKVYCVTTTQGSLTQQQSAEAILTRLDVLLEKNYLLRTNNLKEHQVTVLFYFRQALSCNLHVFLQAVCLAYKHHTPISMIYIYSRLYKY